jgi:outer membrane protein OmpA-like peptidoglycan-associated protein
LIKAICFSLAFFCSLYGHSQSAFSVLFDFNKYYITDEARSQLDSFILNEKEHLSILIIQLHGHCDAIGSDKYNDKLSKQRVEAIKRYLLINEIDKTNIYEAIGHGKKEPLNENRTEEDRKQNRRVEISYFEVVRSFMPGEESLIKILADSTTTAGSNIILRNINFFGGMHQFLPESQPMLNELLEAMKSNPKLVIRVEGHICCQQDKSDGTDLETGINNLSEARAKAVMDYLLANGIESKRVSYKGFGHSSPIYLFPEQTEEERIQNRRVEIKIIGK